MATFWPLFQAYRTETYNFTYFNFFKMLTSSTLLALAASPAMGAYVGFNYGATFTNGAVKVQSDYETEFKAAQALVSAPQTFSSARIYTMIVRTPCVLC